MDVLGRGHRPEAGLVGEFFQALRPVDRAAAAKLLEELVRWAIDPEIARRDFDALEIAANRRHRRLPLLVAAGRCTIVLAERPVNVHPVGTTRSLRTWVSKARSRVPPLCGRVRCGRR